MNWRPKMCLLGLLLVGALAGCAQQSASGPGEVTPASGMPAQQVNIVVIDNAFQPKTIEVQGGVPISLTVTNSGQNIHEVEVKDLMPETKLAPGQSKTLQIESQTAGTHKMYCEIHEDEGMEGEFVVK